MLQLLNELHFEEEKTEIYTMFLIFEAGIIFFNFSTPCIQNVDTTGTKYVRIMKQTAF